MIFNINAQNVDLNGMTLKMNNLKNGPWKLSELKDVISNNKKVFSCFHCGGGSTMGYKLAGYDVLGGVEIDPEMMAVYKANHNPKYSYLMGVQDFKNISNDQLPQELFNLDILDGSPPCSSFSMAGSREKAWGKNKKFREGQAYQVLDDLFFEFIETANKLKPKVIIAENVKGLIMGKAKGYVKQISQQFDEVGYDVQLFLLNAAFMGVPQKRERTFFIARRKDLKLDKLELNFNESPITVKKAFEGIEHEEPKNLTPLSISLWEKIKPGENFGKVHPTGSRWNVKKINPNQPCFTVTGSDSTLVHWEKPRNLSKQEILRLQTFPEDYNFMKCKAGYLCGMSVPPFMMQRIADQIYKQWFNK